MRIPVMSSTEFGHAVQWRREATLVMDNQNVVRETITDGSWGVWSFAILAILLNLAIILVTILVFALTAGLIAIPVINSTTSAVLSLI